MHLSGIPDFNLISAQNHTPATLSIQAQVTVASFGWHWGSLWPLHSLVWSVSCPQPAWLLTLSPLDDFEQLDCTPKPTYAKQPLLGGPHSSAYKPPPNASKETASSGIVPDGRAVGGGSRFCRSLQQLIFVGELGGT